MSKISKQYRIHGLVQGVGFRPFVAEQADVYGVGGYVKNAGGEVILSVKGTSEAVDSFVHRLLQLDGADPALPGARVAELEEIPASAEEGQTSDAADTKQAAVAVPGGRDGRIPEGAFRIIESTDTDDDLRILPPDIATCKRCERELFDRVNRRYRHPFISCVSCGPRFTIMDAVPYDRQRTSMAEFGLCPECRGEYGKAGDVRHYAQTICCKSCGPVVKGVSFLHMDEMASIERNKSASEVAIREAVAVLKKGGIIAIKNVGGYHFAHMADNGAAARRLREAKAREEKPFAVMFRDVAQVETCAKVGMEEEALLTSPARPIVLLRAKENMPIAPEVCGDSNRIGAMLPADPIQLLLLKETGPLVMTSGNLNGEPILTEEEDVFALARLGICDYVLYHGRRITQGLDDSICQAVPTAVGTRVQILRRARGYVPQPVMLRRKLRADTFAAGGDLKAVFALGRRDAAFLSGHFGDLYDVRAEEKRREAAGHLQRLLGITPDNYVCDKHPKYVSAKPLEEKQATLVQHHHAHILSVMAEHHLSGKVLGVAFDGTGYGDDATIWGGEFLLCDGAAYTRAGHLLSVPMAGGDAIAKDAYAAAEGYLYAAEQAGYLKPQEHPFTGEAAMRNAAGEDGMKESIRRQSLRRAAIDRKVGVTPSSSMGRLFDAAAVILGLGEANHFEGQLAMRLQYAAERHEERMGKEGIEDAGQGLPKRDAVGGAGQSFMAPGAVGNITLPFPIIKEPTREGSVYIADTLRLVAALVRERNRALSERGKGVRSPEERDRADGKEITARMDALAYAFCEAVACMTAEMCGITDAAVRDTAASSNTNKFVFSSCFRGIIDGADEKLPVALSGGTFANGLLLRLLLPKLEAEGFRVYMNEKVPCGDGGLALGQLYAATF